MFGCRSDLSVAGKSCVIVGDSNIVGLPLAMLLRDMQAASVTVCHRSLHRPLATAPEAEAMERAQSAACLPVLPGPRQRFDERGQRAEPTEAAGSSWQQHGFCSNLPDIIRTADLLVVAVGSPEMVRASWIKPGALRHRVAL